MKKIYMLFIASLLIVVTANAQDLWENFENTRTGDYFFINGVFIPYNANPDQSGANTSLVAAAYTRNQAELFDVIVIDNPMANVADYVSGTKQMKLDVWSPNAGVTVQITLENNVLAQPANYPQGRHSEHFATTTVTNAWETLTFTFGSQPDASVAHDNVNRLVLLIDPNTNNGGTYYLDNLFGPELSNNPCEGVATDPDILNDFECQQNVNFIFSHSGINFRRIANPDLNNNPSSHVARYSRNGGEEFDVIIGRFNGNLSLNDNSEITLDVWDPSAPTTVLISLQNLNGDVILEMPAQTSASSSWQTLTYDAGSVAGATDIGQFVILFDPGNFSGGQYYFDNFAVQTGSSVNEITALESFSAFPNPSHGQTTFTYDLTRSANVAYTIYDITGKRIAQYNLGNQPAGSNQASWEAKSLANGLYFYTFLIDDKSTTGKIILNR